MNLVGETNMYGIARCISVKMLTEFIIKYILNVDILWNSVQMNLHACPGNFTDNIYFYTTFSNEKSTIETNAEFETELGVTEIDSLTQT